MKGEVVAGVARNDIHFVGGALQAATVLHGPLRRTYEREQSIALHTADRHRRAQAENPCSWAAASPYP